MYTQKIYQLKVTEMATATCVMFCLLTGVVEVYSETFPHIRFMGTRLSNHSYVNLTLVGDTGSDSVQCHTDLASCCSTAQGAHRGDWFFPNGSRLEHISGSADIVQHREAQRVDLRWRGNGVESGIYRCNIETNAVNDNDGNEIVYVGLYSDGGQLIFHCSCLALPVLGHAS